jgi:hypothetical protein
VKPRHCCGRMAGAIHMITHRYSCEYDPAREILSGWECSHVCWPVVPLIPASPLLVPPVFLLSVKGSAAQAPMCKVEVGQ